MAPKCLSRSHNVKKNKIVGKWRLCGQNMATKESDGGGICLLALSVCLGLQTCAKRLHINNKDPDIHISILAFIIKFNSSSEAVSRVIQRASRLWLPSHR